MDKKAIGEKLKKMRTDKNLTVAEMAKIVDVSASAWGMYELGERIPRDEVKIRIANYFKKSVASIFFT